MSKPRKLLRHLVLVFGFGLTGACALTAERPPTVESADDGAVTARVKAVLNTQALDVSDLQVDTVRGVVRLSGFAWDRQSAEHAEALTRKVRGVLDVKNDIVLRGGRQPL